MKIALISAFLDEGYEHILDDQFMEDVVCQEDHFFHRIAYSLKIRNHEPVVFYLSVEKKLKKFTHKYGHSIVRVPAKKIPFIHEPIVYSPELIKQVKNDFDICHLVAGYYVMYKVPDMFDYTVKKLKDKMPIIGRWAGGNHEWLFPFRKWIKKKSLQNCNKIICSSKDEIEVLKNIFKIPDSKIEFMINPHNLSLFKKRNKIEVCKKLEINPNKIYFLYVGRLTINKGIEDLLYVFNELKSIYTESSLILIGDGPLKKKILDYVEKNNLKERISLKGRLSHDEICYYYNISSILFHIGISGGLPNVIIEGIASGIPIIASENNANKEYVKGGTGIIINAGNKQELKNAIIKILEKPDKFSGKIPVIIKEFSYEKFGEKLENVYKNSLESTKK